jgi:outer membrane protein, heavy metal efflux system
MQTKENNTTPVFFSGKRDVMKTVMRTGMLLWLALVAASGVAPAQSKAEKISTDGRVRKATQKIEERIGYPLSPTTKSGEFAPPKGVVIDDGLSEDEAVAIALWNNAMFQADLAQLGLARANLIEAGLLTNPIFGLLFPWGPKQLEAFINWPMEAIWQRPRRIAAAKVDLERLSESLAQTGLDLVRNVRLAYINLAIAEERARIAVEQLDERSQIVQIVNAQFRAGEIADLDASVPRIDARMIEEQQSRFQMDADTARVRLRALMGMERADLPIKISAPPVEPTVALVLPDLVKTALASRPELRAAELALETAGARAKWERTRIFTLMGILDMNGDGKQGFESGPGLQVELPIFHRNKGGITRADAEVERAARLYAATRQRIVMEVQESYTQYELARESTRLWRARVLPPIEDAIARSQKAYDAGDISYLPVLENTRRLTDARLLEVDIKAVLQRASTELDRSIGRKINPRP